MATEIGLIELLDRIERRSVNLAVHDGRLRVEAPAGALTEAHWAAIAHHKTMVIATVLGRGSGHSPYPCTECGEVSMVKVGNSPKCRMTPRCTGKHAAPTHPAATR